MMYLPLGWHCVGWHLCAMPYIRPTCPSSPFVLLTADVCVAHGFSVQCSFQEKCHGLAVPGIFSCALFPVQVIVLVARELADALAKPTALSLFFPFPFPFFPFIC